MERGFTLVELLVVIAIIGVLAAIAIPQYNDYKTNGYDASALSDLRNAITAQEAYFVDNSEYAAALPLPGFELTSDVTVELTGGETFTITSWHSRGSRTYSFDSGGENGIESSDGVGGGAGGMD